MTPQSQQTFNFQAGQVGLGVFNDSQSQIEYTAQHPISLVHLHVQPEAIGLLHPQELQRLPVALRDALNGCRSSYFQSSPMTPVMRAIVQQLLNCPYQGLSERLYLESKALELTSLSFDSLLSREISSPQAADLCQDEADRIHRARDILLSRLSNPPTLLELAHDIGLNDRKLKQGFRKLFGTTVFGYLHDYRMQQAQQLLQLPKATVASVAQSIGYSNPEAFSVAFRRTFAITPKAYQIRQRTPFRWRDR
jgi:AraC-like DNA-binding protein